MVNPESQACSPLIGMASCCPISLKHSTHFLQQWQLLTLMPMGATKSLLLQKRTCPALGGMTNCGYSTCMVRGNMEPSSGDRKAEGHEGRTRIQPVPYTH